MDLLSKLASPTSEGEDEEQSQYAYDEPDIKDNFFEANVFNSNAFSP